MKKVSIAKEVLKDIAALSDPKTASAVLGLAVVLVGPLLDWHPNGQVETAIIGAIVAVGVVVSFVEKQLGLAVTQAKAEAAVAHAAQVAELERQVQEARNAPPAVTLSKVVQ